MLPSQPAHSADLDIPALVAGCADLRDGARLSADNDVLCFDGSITWDTPLAPLHELNSGGTLVVRSGGGLLFLAMQMADVLLEKNARVVIHDYCMSACAMALFIASQETHVAAGAIVAWHHGPQSLERRASEPPRRSAGDFYRKRGISDDFASRPQTPYSRKMLHAMRREEFDKRRIFWTWHPENFRGYFKSKIVFQSFPSQEFVEARLRAWRARVVYDPPPAGTVAPTTAAPTTDLHAPKKVKTTIIWSDDLPPASPPPDGWPGVWPASRTRSLTPVAPDPR